MCARRLEIDACACVINVQKSPHKKEMRAERVRLRREIVRARAQALTNCGNVQQAGDVNETATWCSVKARSSPSPVARRRPRPLLCIDQLLASLASSRWPLLLSWKSHHAAKSTYMARLASLNTVFLSLSDENREWARASVQVG